MWRERLLAPLIANEQPNHTVTMVSASAGAGKTMLLAQWWQHLRAERAHAAWLTLDDGDNDPLTFWSGILAACRKAADDTQAAVHIDVLRPPVDAMDAGFLASFYQAIEPLDGDLWLILDDVHELTAAPVLDGLSHLLRTAPAALKLMLGCRYDPPLPLPRMVLEGTAGEIRAVDLAFDGAEARELLLGHGIDLTNEEVGLLLSRTEGWAAGLKLAALSLTGQKDLGRYLDTIAEDDRPVADYLVSEVLSQLPAETESFLLVTAVPERLTIDLARELSGRADAGSVLDQLAHDNALVYRQDSSPKLYYYHSLLRAYLLAELQRRDASAASRLHRAAAGWFSGRGAAREALEHAVAGKAWPDVLRIIDRHGLRLILTGDTGALARAVDALPDDMFADPHVSLTAALAALHDGKLAAAQTHLDRIGRSSRHDDSRLRLLHVTAMLHEARLRGERSPRVHRLIEETRVHVVDDPDLRLMAAAGRGAMLATLGELAAADDELSLALRLAHEHDCDLLALDCMSHLALSAAVRGDAAGMIARVELALDFATERGWSASPPMAGIYLSAAWAAWNTSQLERAERFVSLAAGVDADVASSITLSVRLLSAYIEFERTGDHGRLSATIAKAWANTAEELVAPMSVSHYCMHDIRTALAVENRGWVREAADRARRLLGAEAADVAVMEAVVRAHDGRGAAARVKLAPILAGHVTCHGVMTGITAWLVETHLADVHDEPVRAHDALLRAIGLAAPRREIRTVATASERVRRLMIRSRGRFGRHEDFIDEVLATARDISGAVDQSRPAEALTRREFELLCELPSMLSMEEIAHEKAVSVNTVKTHLSALYRKLDVVSRREAVARGRELGLL